MGQGIDTMTPDELNRAVAEKVMGWQLSSIEQPPGLWNLFYVYRDKWDALRKQWSPSTNIAHAWEVVEKLKSLTLYAPGQKIDDRGEPVKRWTALFQIPGQLQWVEGDGETVPLAICRAALAAVGKAAP